MAPLRPHRHALGEARSVVAARPPGGAPFVDRSVLPGFTYYLQGGDPTSYPGSGQDFTTLPPSPPSVQYNATSKWYRYNSRLDPEANSAPTFQDGWFRLPSGGAAPFHYLAFAQPYDAEGIALDLNGQGAATGATQFWRLNLSSSLASQVITAVAQGGLGGGQFASFVNPGNVAIDRGYIVNAGTVATVVPRDQDIVLAIRRTGPALGTWSVFVDGVLQGSFTSSVQMANSGTSGIPPIPQTRGLGFGIIRPPNDGFSAVVFFDGKFQSYLAYDVGLSDADILFNSQRLALWGDSPP